MNADIGDFLGSVEEFASGAVKTLQAKAAAAASAWSRLDFDKREQFILLLFCVKYPWIKETKDSMSALENQLMNVKKFQNVKERKQAINCVKKFLAAYKTMLGKGPVRLSILRSILPNQCKRIALALNQSDDENIKNIVSSWTVVSFFSIYKKGLNQLKPPVKLNARNAKEVAFDVGRYGEFSQAQVLATAFENLMVGLSRSEISGRKYTDARIGAFVPITVQSWHPEKRDSAIGKAYNAMIPTLVDMIVQLLDYFKKMKGESTKKQAVMKYFKAEKYFSDEENLDSLKGNLMDNLAKTSLSGSTFDQMLIMSRSRK
jgi:hypothetical protein